MEAAKIYQGHLMEDGRFVPDESIDRIPTPCRVFVSIPVEELTDIGTPIENFAHRKQVTAVKRFLAAVADLTDEDDVMVDSDCDELANLRNETNAGFNRRITL